ncbi:MAG TPA: hypothetical protein K8W06_04475 [Limosilactobacillus coleohominis]|nr:hypothetical protein [Limosilactobacillus coleohominis]
MSWNNDNVPKIILDYDDSNLRQTMAQISATLDKNEFGAGGRRLRNMTAMASVSGERATNKMAERAKGEVLDLMRDRQYNQPSYGPEKAKAWHDKHNNARMVDNLKDHVKGNHHEIYTTTTNGGYNYSQAFEFGLLTRNYPAHHPFEDAANHLNLNQLNGPFEQAIDEAIRKGFS